MPAIPHYSTSLGARNAAPAASTSSTTFHHILTSGVQRLARRLVSGSSSSSTTTTNTNPHNPTLLHARQDSSSGGTVAIPTIYQGLNSGPAPGTIVGITLGAIVGFVLLVWLFSAVSGNNNSSGGVAVMETEEIQVRRQRSRSPSRHRRASRRGGDVSSRSPRRERIVRQERIIRESSRGGASRGAYFPPSEDRPRVDGDDIVEVIEEDSSVGPRRSRRGGHR